VARLAALFCFYDSGHLDSVRADRDEIDEPTVKSAIEVCQWYAKEFGRIFNPDMAIEEAATHVLTKLKERVASKNGGQIPEIATLGNQNVEMPEKSCGLSVRGTGLNRTRRSSRWHANSQCSVPLIREQSLCSFSRTESEVAVQMNGLQFAL